MNPTKRERIAMLAKENEDLKIAAIASTTQIQNLTDANTALQIKLDTATPLHGNTQYPVRVEYKADPVLEQECKDLEAQLAAMSIKLAAYKWQPTETSPENCPILVEYDGNINEIGNVHVHVRRGNWWYGPGHDGRRLHAPARWMRIPT